MTYPTPELKKLSGGFLNMFPLYRLLKDYHFEFSYNHRPAAFTIPAGFEFDGATFGSFLFWRKSLHESRYTLAHDWLYLNLGDVGARYSDETPVGALSKTTVDGIFLKGARQDINVQRWRDRIASLAFRTVGALLWNMRKLRKKI